MYSHRDTAVIPWLPEYQRSPSSGGPKTSATASASPRRPCKIIRLLSARERIGLKSKCTRVGSLSEGVLVSNEELSGAGAWNVRRLQNTILAIGPGTPASCVLSSIPAAGAGGASGGDDHDSVSSNDEDDIYNADSNDEEEDDIEMLEDEWPEDENDDDVDSEDDGKEEEESKTNTHFKVGSSNTHVGEDEGFRRDDKKSLEETTSKSHEDIHTSDDDQREVKTEIAGQLAARPHENERDAEDSQEHQRSTGQRSAWTRTIGNALPAGSDDYDDDSHHTHMDSGHEDTSEETAHMNQSRARQAGQVIEFLHNQIMRQQRRLRRSQQRQPVSTASHGTNLQPPQQYEREVARSMKHGGCINTACWLDCGWRISTVSHEDANPYDRFYNKEFIASDCHSCNDNHLAPSWQRSSYNNGVAVLSSPSEYPTQLITSGDDHLVKFWDVSQSMGSISPLPGGSATLTPFSSPRVPMRASSELITRWRERVNINDDNPDEWSSFHKQRKYLPGIVHPLLTLSTGHRGNVFHVTPVPNTPGKVLTCAADGYLRLSDVEINAISSPAALQRDRSTSISSVANVGEASTIIISPEYRSDNGESEAALRFRDSLMCFSHHFLTSNVGLVCSERGLLHFDLRLPPSSQKRESLVEELSATCKSCCVWTKYNEDSDSAYVFGK
ncbi:hypothetical protein ACHAWX_005610 [Stephanocyclus meneghinianus]